jgi:hypothetical protein
MSSMTHKMWSQWKDYRLDELKDHEGSMAKSQLERSKEYSEMIYKIIDNVGDGGEVNLPAWVQSKLTDSMEDLQSVYNYLDGKDGLDDKFQEANMYVPGSSKIKSKFNPKMMKYSNPEAKRFAEDDVKKMGKELNKASQKSIAIMLGSVKNGKYDAMDMIRAIKAGGSRAGDTSAGVPEMLNVLWSKVEKRFRKYLSGKKRR